MWLRAERFDAGVRFREIEALPGWTVTVGDEGGVTLTPPAGERVSVESWRKVPIATVMRSAQSEMRGDLFGSLLSLLAGSGDVGRSSRSGDQHLRTVATIYRISLENGLSPRKVLAEHYRVDESSAQRWIKAARDREFIGKYRDELARHGWPPAARKYVEARQVARTRGEQPAPVTTEDLAALRELLDSPERRRSTGRVRSATERNPRQEP